jgi:hypothetical protein
MMAHTQTLHQRLQSLWHLSMRTSITPLSCTHLIRTVEPTNGINGRRKYQVLLEKSAEEELDILPIPDLHFSFPCRIFSGAMLILQLRCAALQKNTFGAGLLFWCCC